VIFQGAKGSFSEQAARKFFGRRFRTIGVYSFEEIFDKIKTSTDLYGVIPIENSLSGSIHHNYDLLLESGCYILGELELKISFSLMAAPSTDLDTIREIQAHPVVFEQCRKFLRKHTHLKPVSVYDSAGAAQKLNSSPKRDVAVIAGTGVNKIYGLKVLQPAIEDAPQNYTRFLLIKNKKEIYSGKNAKTTLVFGVENSPGILFRCLSVFALRNIDLTKIESRPIIGKPWEYLFYIDFRGSIDDANCYSAITELGRQVVYCRFLGSYQIKGRFE